MQTTRRYNDLKTTNERLTNELKSKLDRLNEEKKNFEALDSMRKAETDEGFRIEKLREEIGTVEGEIFKLNQYTRQLEHMSSRLKRNQVKFDAHMTGMEEVMASIQREGMEVRLMRKSLDAGLAKAMLVYEETQGRLAVARKDRDSSIAIRRSEYANAQVLEEWMRQRESEKEALAKELRGELTQEEENFLRAQIASKQDKVRSLQRLNEECNKRYIAMEEAFSQLKQVTGVSSLVDMYDKFSNQKGKKSDLLQEVRDAEARLEAVKQAQLKYEETFSELRASGGASNEKSPTALVPTGAPSVADEAAKDSTEHLESTIDAAKKDCKVARASSDRLESVLLGLQQGANGLHSRVQPYMHLTDGGVFELTQAVDDSQPWADTLEHLSLAEQVLSKMMEVLSGAAEGVQSPSKWMAAALDEEEEDEMSIDSHSVGTIGEAPSYAYNVRIKSKKLQRDLEAKRQAGAEKGQKAAEKAGYHVPFGGEEGEEYDESALPPAQGRSKSHGPVAVGAPEIKLSVPTRLTVKKASTRAQTEEKRRVEMEIKQKTLEDKMMRLSSRRNQIEGGDDSAIGNLALLLSQQACAERLSTTHSVLTLPPGVTLKDDPMTKTKAFLTTKPALT